MNRNTLGRALVAALLLLTPFAPGIAGPVNSRALWSRLARALPDTPHEAFSSVASVVRSGALLEQRHLAAAWRAMDGIEAPFRFRKEPNIGFRITGPDSVPPGIVAKLGEIDGVSHAASQIPDNIRNSVILQRIWKDGAWVDDFYIAGNTNSEYRLIDAPGPALVARRAELIRRFAPDPEIDPGLFEVLQKQGITEMRPAGSLGIPDTPGGFGMRTAHGTDQYGFTGHSWIAKDARGRFHKVEADPQTGLPISYLLDGPIPPVGDPAAVVFRTVSRDLAVLGLGGVAAGGSFFGQDAEGN